MATQNTTTTGGYIYIQRDAFLFSWDDTRNSTTGTSVSVNPSVSRAGVYEIFGRGNTYNINRTYLAFDLSSVSGTITDIDLVLTANANVGSPGGFIILKSSAPGLAVNLTTSDFKDVNFSVPYSSNFGWSASSTNTITLNSSAITDANNDSSVTLAIVDWEYDYGNNIPPATLANYIQIQYSTGTAPYLSYTAVTQYGNIVTGVIPANIGKVNGVATANIGNIIGI